MWNEPADFASYAETPCKIEPKFKINIYLKRPRQIFSHAYR